MKITILRAHLGRIRKIADKKSCTNRSITAVTEMNKIMMAGGPPQSQIHGSLFYRVSPVLVKIIWSGAHEKWCCLRSYRPVLVKTMLSLTGVKVC
jgi:hypothetical protein